jgi:chromosome segregation ATPase
MKQLESALFNELIPAKKDIIRRRLSDELATLSGAQYAALSAKTRGIMEQLLELKGLRGKNQTVIAHMARRVEAEKKEFDESLFKLQATRAVFTRLSTELYSSLGMDVLRDNLVKARSGMQNSRFTTGLRDAINNYFDSIHANLDESERKIEEIRSMMETMYKKFSAEHGLTLASPMAFSLAKYRDEINEAHGIYEKQFGTAMMLTTTRVVLMERFFDSVASAVKRCFKAANADTDAWLKVIMAPLESQIRQHKEQLKHRQASIQRIHDATDTLEQKIETFESTQAALEQQKAKLAALAAAINDAISAEPVVLEAAA